MDMRWELATLAASWKPNFLCYPFKIERDDTMNMPPLPNLHRCLRFSHLDFCDVIISGNEGYIDIKAQDKKTHQEILWHMVAGTYFSFQVFSEVIRGRWIKQDLEQVLKSLIEIALQEVVEKQHSKKTTRKNDGQDTQSEEGDEGDNEGDDEGDENCLGERFQAISEAVRFYSLHATEMSEIIDMSQEILIDKKEHTITMWSIPYHEKKEIWKFEFDFLLEAEVIQCQLTNTSTQTVLDCSIEWNDDMTPALQARRFIEFLPLFLRNILRNILALSNH